MTEYELNQAEWERHYGTKNADGYSEASVQAQRLLCDNVRCPGGGMADAKEGINFGKRNNNGR